MGEVQREVWKESRQETSRIDNWRFRITASNLLAHFWEPISGRRLEIELRNVDGKETS